MQTLSIPYSEDLLVATGFSAAALEADLRFWLAVKLFEIRRLSLGKSAELCRMRKFLFAEELGKLKIPIINLEDDQIQDELSVEIPNETTIKAFEEDESAMPVFHSIEELRRDLYSEMNSSQRK